MSYPIENKIKLIQYVLVWLAYALLQAVAMLWIVPLGFGYLLLDALAHAAIFAVIAVLLWGVILYGNYDKMPMLQSFINYGALLLLILLVWLGVGYGLDFLFFGEEDARLFLPVMPVYGMTGILLFMVVILSYRNKITHFRLDEEDDLPSTEQVLEIGGEDNHANEHEMLERIAVKSGQKIHVILVPDILYLQAEGDYVRIFTSDGKYLKEQTMKYFEENLPLTQFVRVHRSYIVNVEAISRIELYEKQSQLLTLKNGMHIKASLTGYKLLKNRLGL